MVDDLFPESSTVDIRTQQLTPHFEELCPTYLAMGMTYDEYWNNDVCIAPMMRRAHAIKMRTENQMLWLQGRYIYDVLTQLYPLYNGWAKGEVSPYTSEPYPLTVQEDKERKEAKSKAEMERVRKYLERKMSKYNSEK